MEIWSKCDICGRDIPVGELCYGLKKGNCICKNCCTGFENCTFTLAPAPTLTPPNEWISVEDRLPPNMDDVLVVVRDNGECWTATGYYSSMSKVWYAVLNGQDMQMDVLWWMPFPASPDSRQPEGEDT